MKTQVILGDSVEVHFENRYALVYWSSAHQCVGTWWKKAEFGEDWAGSDTVKESLDKGLELVRAKHATRWLADCRDMAVLPPDIQKWLIDDWWPRALAAGFRWLALLLPKSTITKMAIDVSLRPSREAVQSETRYFGDVDEARAWLQAVSQEQGS